MKSKNMYLIVIFNIVIVILVTTFAWMITDPSVGEIIGYQSQFVIPDSNVNVDFYVLKNHTYLLQSQVYGDPLINIDLMQPGSIQRYRFDITSVQEVVQSVKIVFTGITGDVELLDDFITINCTNPYIFTRKLSDILEYDEVNEYYYFNLFDSLNIPAEEMVSIYWNIAISQQAGNEIENAELLIDKVLFINP